MQKKISQVEFARMISSSQTRVAKMETGDISVSIDLLLKSLFALGLSRKEVARILNN